MNKDKILAKLKNKGIVTLSDLIKMGLSQPTVSRLALSGKIQHLSRGLYIHPDSKVVKPEELDFILACIKFGGKAVIGGISALFYYKLIEQIPHQTWVIVPSNIICTDHRYRLIRSSRKLKHGIIKNNKYKIVSIERALIESLLYANKFGLSTAIEAITRAIRRKQTTIKKIAEMAKKMKLEKTLAKHWESIIGAISA